MEISQNFVAFSEYINFKDKPVKVFHIIKYSATYSLWWILCRLIGGFHGVWSHKAYTPLDNGDLQF